MDFQLLRRIREYELEQVLPLLPARSKVLEIGAGAGWQARMLAQRGFSVVAIDVDLPGIGYQETRIWPVIRYDGVTIPFPDRHFDVAFSSNVLEHVPQVARLQAEIRRVLKPGGIAVHVLPTGSWRFWSNVTYYPTLIRRMLTRSDPDGQPSPATVTGSAAARRAGPQSGIWGKMRRLALPSRHGERGNVLTEVYLFSRLAWDALFRATGWEVVACYPNRLFYSGYSLLGRRLGLEARHWLSYLLGSSCLIYVLR